MLELVNLLHCFRIGPVLLPMPLFCVPDCLGLLYAGDKLVEVNGVSVEGLAPEQVIHILVTASPSCLSEPQG